MTRIKLRVAGVLVAAVASASGFAGCGDDDDPMGSGPRVDGSVDGGMADGSMLPPVNIDSSVPSVDGATVAPPIMMPTACPAEGQRATQIVTGAIAADTTWDCNKTYLLSNYVFVKGGATLKILPGTIIKGDGSSALFVTREGKIDAQGTATQPIVFTSIGNPGSRVSGGWQGLALLGKATLNVGTVDREFEGLTTNNPDYRYGGSDDAHNCGTLKYVRIEFGGHELQPNKELNNLTVSGCGSATTIDFVQLHKGKDDGIEFFGGTASAKHLVITGSDDDNIDWDEGWRGRIQFAAIQQHDLSGAGDSNGFEASNRAMAFDAMPLAMPRIYNVTMVGDRQSTHPVRAMLLKDGTRGEIKNVLATGFATTGIDVVTKESADALRAVPAALSVTNSLFHAIGAGGAAYFPVGDMGDDNLDEAATFRAAAAQNRFDLDPKLPDAFNFTAPGWIPPSDSPAATGGATPPSDGWFDASATYVGAFKPGGPDWATGWTSYAAN
jgi:hypothetical protein